MLSVRPIAVALGLFLASAPALTLAQQADAPSGLRTDTTAPAAAATPEPAPAPDTTPPAAPASAVAPTPAAPTPAGATPGSVPTPSNIVANFGPWIADCAADGTCRADARSATGSEILTVIRFSGQDGYAIGFATRGALNDVDRPINLRVDQKMIATVDKPRGYGAFGDVDTFFLIDPKRAGAVLAALLKSKSARVEFIDIGGRPYDADFATESLAQALDYLEQKAGFKPKTRAAVALPKTLLPAPPVDKAARLASSGLPPRLVQRHNVTSDCEDPFSPSLSTVKPVIGALSSTAMLYAVPCLRGQFQVSYRLYVVESGEIGGITPIYFAAYDPSLGWRGTDLLGNVAYDADSRRLKTLWKASGPGDCGWTGTWRWQSFAFALEEVRAQVACDGSRPDPASWDKVFGK